MAARDLPLGVKAAIRKMEEIARPFAGARVDRKVNAKGELVVAIIFPKEYAPEADGRPRKYRRDD